MCVVIRPSENHAKNRAIGVGEEQAQSISSRIGDKDSTFWFVRSCWPWGWKLLFCLNSAITVIISVDPESASTATPATRWKGKYPTLEGLRKMPIGRSSVEPCRAPMVPRRSGPLGALTYCSSWLRLKLLKHTRQPRHARRNTTQAPAIKGKQ